MRCRRLLQGGRHRRGPSPDVPTHRRRGLLANAGFRWLLSARVAGQTGDGLIQVGLVGLLFFDPARQTTPAAAALAFAATLLPYTVVGPVAGVLLDRWSRRQVVLVANALRAVVALTLAVLVAGGGLGAGVLGLALVALGLNRFFLAGQSAGLPHVVPGTQLVSANSLTPTLGTLAATGGAWVGAGILAGLGSGPHTQGIVLALGALCYLASAVVTLPLGRWALGPDRPNAAGMTDVASAMRATAAAVAAGVRHIRGHEDARAALSTITALRTSVGLSAIATLVLCRNFLAHSPEQGLALATTAATAAGLGAGAAALLTPAATSTIGAARWTGITLLSAAAAALALALAPGVTTLIGLSGLLGLAAFTTKIEIDSTLQATVEDAYRGRVFAVYDALGNASFVVAAALAALAVPASGHSPVVFAAIAVTLAAAGVRVRVRGLRLAASPA